MATIKFFDLTDLTGRLAKASNDNRFDQVSRTMQEIFDTKAEKHPEQIISSVDFRKVYSDVANLNPDSNFRDYFEDIFAEDEEESHATIQEGSPFRLAEFQGEDFRPTPIEVETTVEQKIQSSSLPHLKAVASNMVNPQYHLNQFIRVAKFGRDSGIAHWTVSFNTRKGLASVNVPVTVVAGEAVKPELFYTPENNVPRKLDPDNLSDYSSNPFIPEKESITESSNFETIGVNAMVTDRHTIAEGPSVDEEISVGNSTLVEEDLVANVGKVSVGLSDAVEIAREYAEEKIAGSNSQIHYSGAVDLEGNEIPSDAVKVENAHLAFNVHKNSLGGIRTATIPVTIKNNIVTADKFYGEDNSEHDLTTESLNDYFSAKHASNDTAEEAFVNSFLATEASFKQVKEAMMDALKDNNFKRAQGCLEVIGKRFGDNALTASMDDFATFVKVANTVNEHRVVEMEPAFEGSISSYSVHIN